MYALCSICSRLVSFLNVLRISVRCQLHHVVLRKKDLSASTKRMNIFETATFHGKIDFHEILCTYIFWVGNLAPFSAIFSQKNLILNDGRLFFSFRILCTGWSIHFSENWMMPIHLSTQFAYLSFLGRQIDLLVFFWEMLPEVCYGFVRQRQDSTPSGRRTRLNAQKFKKNPFKRV